MKSGNKKLFNIVAARNGQLYEVRTETIGIMVSVADEIRELEEVPTGFKFGLPKIPGSMLSQIQCFFKEYCTEWMQNEVMVQIFWDLVEEKYIVECPHQMVKKDRIHATFNKRLEDDERFIEVCHIHSHNTMPSGFSEIDDENEKAFMIYGVIGRLHRNEPDMDLRVGYNGKYFLLPLDYIFDNPKLDNPVMIAHPPEWSRRVHIIQ